MKITEIKELLLNNPSSDFLDKLKSDERASVQKLVISYENKKVREAKELVRLGELNKYEESIYEQGYNFIAGIDEAGRGPLAGPLVIASVILPKGSLFLGLNDSKKVAEKRRKELFCEIKEKAIAFNVEIVSAKIVDELNIYQATLQGMKRSLLSLETKPDFALIDAMPLTNMTFSTISLVHGDSLSASIAAASIIAKVTRDDIMAKLHEEYPEYGFLSNKGYGTKEHMEAIEKYGATPEHRLSYEPLKSITSGG